MQAKNELQYREAWKRWASELAGLCLAANDSLSGGSDEYKELRAKLDDLIDRAAKNQNWDS